MYRTVYAVRHWRLTLAIWLLMLFGRFIAGRDLRHGGRKTDATFFRSARRIHGSWWATRPGVVRLAVRLAALGLLPLWACGGKVWLGLAAGLGLAAVVWVGVRQIRQERHLDAHVRPVWPAVAGIIGVPAEESPAAWLDVPADLAADGAEITVGLRAASADDERRVAHLVTLFTQRLGIRMAARVDYAARLVHVFPRRPEPAVWPAVAQILGVPAEHPAEAWLTVEDGVQDKANMSAAVTVRLPDDLVDDEPVTESLQVLIEQRYPGEWSVKTDRQKRRAVLRHKPPVPVPPRMVDLFAEYPIPLVPTDDSNGNGTRTVLPS